MSKLIYIVMRVGNFGPMSEIAFTSRQKAEEYGKQKEAQDENYRWYLSSIYLEDEKQ